jgi:uncharacterized Zn-finger protein
MSLAFDEVYVGVDVKKLECVTKHKENLHAHVTLNTATKEISKLFL